jgi:serine/threonine protein kinase
LVTERYELGDLLGRGGMGEVRLSVDHKLDRVVAVKLLRQDMAAQPSIRRRFEAEARAAAQVVHPNVVLVLDTGEQDGVPFIVMERLSGRTLREEIREGPLTAAATQRVGLQVLAALDAAHRAGLVHRDIKPGNILVADPGVWKVADFGIAKSLEAADSELTSAGLVLGTPAYLAPERLNGTPATVSSDLYAVGAVLYQCLTGRPPFEADSPLALAALVATQRPEPLAQCRPDLAPRLAATVERAMAADPADRFRSARAMAAALQEAIDDEDDTVALDATRRSPARLPVPPATVAPATAAPATAAPATVALPSSRPRLRPRVAPVAAVATALVVVVVIVIALLAGGGGSRANAPTTPTSVPAGLDRALRQLEHDVLP